MIISIRMLLSRLPVARRLLILRMGLKTLIIKSIPIIARIRLIPLIRINLRWRIYILIENISTLSIIGIITRLVDEVSQTMRTFGISRIESICTRFTNSMILITYNCGHIFIIIEFAWTSNAVLFLHEL